MRRSVGGILLIVCVVILARLAQRDFEFPLDADFRTGAMTEWRHFFTSFSSLSKPEAYAYFDGQLIINGLVGAVLQATAGILPLFLKVRLGSEGAFSVASSTIVGVMSYAGACVLFYASIVRATGNITIAVVAAIALLLAPQMLANEVMRQDFLVTFPMMVVFYCSVVIAQSEERPRHAVALGLALGLLATIKLNGPMFGALPALAVIARAKSAWLGWRHILRFIGIALAVFVGSYLILMARFVYYYSLAEWLALYPTGVQAFTSWKEILPWGVSLYYNWDLVREHGDEFVWLYLACSAALVPIAIQRRDSVATFILLAVVSFSLFSAFFTMKYTRGGYHLVPLFLAAIAYATSVLWTARRFRPLRLAALLLIAAVMASSLWRSAEFYQSRVVTARESSRALFTVWRPARDWLRAHLGADSRLCIQRHSEWTLPVAEFSRQVVYGPFDFPYTERAKMAVYRPPDEAGLKAECDYLVLGSFHMGLYADQLKRAAPENAERWEGLYRTLKEHPPVVFEASALASPTKWIEIYSIR